MSDITSQSFPYPDRRQPSANGPEPFVERRQFGNSHSHLSPGARELGTAIDRYKLEHRRRFVTYEEIYEIILKLGYTKPEAMAQKQA
ncbi:MAG: hypothetical protein R3B96_22990 [Pirellulaceae bacterium]